MNSYGGRRGGPMRATPANVQCQKCLKRGHYSYECKATTQERPYTSRPSRSQQLRNPKLVPKLTNDTLNPLVQKKGVADEQLAKREAERARKRALDDQDEESTHTDAKRRRSLSLEPDSAPSNPRRQNSGQESPRSMRDESPYSNHSWGQSRSRSRSISRSRSRSRSPHGDRNPPHPPEPSRFSSRESRSPSVERRGQQYRDQQSPPRSTADDRLARRRRRYSSASMASRDSRARLRDLSRSPGANARRDSAASHLDGQNQPQGPPFRGGGGHVEEGRDNAARERSLSPFSRRLALTRAMGPARG